MGEIPRSHSIRTLISILFDSTKDKELLEFSKKNRLTLRLLKHAYIASRYLFDRFDKDDAEEAIKVAEKVFNVVQKLFENINETGWYCSKLEKRGKKVAKAISDVLPDAEIYVFGSAVKRRITASSDIDLLIFSEKIPEKNIAKMKIILEIENKAKLPRVSSIWIPLS